MTDLKEFHNVNAKKLIIDIIQEIMKEIKCHICQSPFHVIIKCLRINLNIQPICLTRLHKNRVSVLLISFRKLFSHPFVKNFLFHISVLLI